MRTDTAVLQVLQNALQASNLRQQVYANNVANAETPGYKRQDVVFESMLQNAMQQSQNGAEGGNSSLQDGGLNFTAAAAITPEVVTDNNTLVDNNGNNVDLDAEMANMAENQIRYETLLQTLSDSFSRMKTAIDN